MQVREGKGCNNTREVAVFGTAGTPAEIFFVFRQFPRVEFLKFVFINTGFLSDTQKDTLLKYEGILPCSITFAQPEDCKSNSFDLVICLSTSFRSVSPYQYHKDNKALESCGIDTRLPIWSDANHICDFVLCSINLMKFLLNLCKIGGLVIIYPSAVPFSVFGAYEGNKEDFIIRDTEAEVVYENTVNVHWPSYCTNPLTLQLEKTPGYYSGKFVAAELLQIENSSRDDATFDIRETAPELVELFGKKGFQVVLSILINACCAEKVKHVDYKVDMELLKEPLQLPTATMKRIEKPGFLENSKNRRFASSVYFGGRYQLCAREVRRVCSETDEKWFRTTYGSRKGF